MKKPATSSLYWTCQATAWLAYGVAVAVPYLLRPTLPAGKLMAYSLGLAVLGLVETHGLRAYAKRNGWDRLEVRRVVPRVVLSSALMGAVMNVFMVLCGIYWFRQGTWRDVPLEWQLMSWVWWFFPVFVGWQTIYFAVHFMRRARRAEVDRWRLDAEARAAELRFLRAQLNPHFLFNALNGLRALIAEDPERARTMVTQLAALLRHSLSSADGTVPLERELEVVGDYLAVESIRLEERLRVTYDIDPSALRSPVPPMLVQGLVENGIKHGIALLPQGGELAIQARLSDSVLHLSVTNPTAKASSADRPGVGLANARERLRLLCGDGAVLDLDLSSPGSATARVLIPQVAQ
jgi:hypothetical protein